MNEIAAMTQAEQDLGLYSSRTQAGTDEQHE
jgi:hypothetical protein